MVTCIIIIVSLLAIICVGFMLYQLKRQPAVHVSPVLYVKLVFSGILAFIADTVGVGSFAVNIALAKIFGTFKDAELPAMNNGAQLIPGTIESLFFIRAIDVDFTTLFVLVAGTCIGGLFGGRVVSKLSTQAIRIAMMGCFCLIICLLIGNELHLLPIGGSLLALTSWKLVIGFVAMMLCGALTCVGIGLFAMVQGVLFLLNMSPAVAFPIMMTAGAMQQPLTTLVFLQQGKIPLKKTLILSLGGCVGVAIILPLFHYLTVGSLHMLLLAILTYNMYSISHAYFKTRKHVLHDCVACEAS